MFPAFEYYDERILKEICNVDVSEFERDADGTYIVYREIGSMDPRNDYVLVTYDVISLNDTSDDETGRKANWPSSLSVWISGRLAEFLTIREEIDLSES